MDLRTTYLHLDENDAAKELPVGLTFWQEIGGRTESRAR